MLVDRITELEPDKRIVGIKNVSLNERYLSREPGEPPALPPTILTEAIAQVGAILILSKPENRERLPFFMGIERVRYYRPVRPGDVVEIEARVKRLRSRVGQLSGFARVNGRVVVEGHDDVCAGRRASTSPRHGRRDRPACSRTVRADSCCSLQRRTRDPMRSGIGHFVALIPADRRSGDSPTS